MARSVNIKTILKYGVAIYAGTIGTKYMLLKIKLKHFELSEFRGKWPLLATGLLVSLDFFRDLIDFPVYVSPARGAMIPDSTTTRKETSQHFLGRAIDVIILKSDMTRKGLNISDVIEKAKNAGFTGIGLYPASADNPDRIRLHLDIRIPKKKDHVAMWGTMPGNDKSYISLMEATKYV